ncbi:choice-of-anchor P family protein [Pseudofrankia inefficax]|uniref:Uncharacterized protein n=1 Tax=Pseudofrankia inefficax (strain DSM 45817 / CECT 9037 / DDB 130130 / EuI1c) TaxID=298654 RepID=E3IWV4_PSEI1|nr:choice-of-anchor P family protein [Pseudofrankia inefficax]ADP82578.1 hypothetical protein FraEuI1c_4585 [Pseudofrankia inefficax]
MKLWAKRATHTAGVLVAAAGLALAASAPASAAPPNTATGLKATGLIPANPLVASAFPGTSPNHAASLNLPPLLTTGAVDTAAGPTTASATVSGLNISLSPLASLTAGTLTSNCSYNSVTGVVSADSNIENGKVVLLGTPIFLTPHPTPNTTLTLPGLATLILNRQTTGPDGTVTVDALSVSLVSGLENVVLATSTCNAATLS